MSQVTYATFDAQNIGSHLGLSNGNLQLATQVTSDNLRMARSTATAFVPSNVEFLIYSPDATKPTLASKAMMIGLCTSAATFGNYLGADANGWGYSPSDGNLYTNGAVAQFFGTATYGDYITLEVDTKNRILSIFKNGAVLGTYALPSNKKFYFAATVSGTPTGMALLGNTGAAPFQYPIANLSGWWSPRVTINPVYLGTEPFISAPTDTLKHQKFSGDIDRAQSVVTISRGVNFWPWGASRPSSMASGASISIDLLDPNKLYDAMLTSDVRDLPVVLSRVAQDGTLNGAEPVYRAVMDRVEQTSDQTKRVILKDKIVLAQAQLTRPIFPPPVEPAVAGKTRPMALGICRNYTPDLYDGTNFNYACSDGPLTAFGTVRIQGVPQVYGGSYVITPDGAGIQLITSGTPTAPAGKLTVESTSFAGTFSATSSDFLQGYGAFGSLAINGGTALPTIICFAPWAQSTAYKKGQYIVNGANLYWCTIAGTSLSSGTGPTGTGVVTDGTVTWNGYANASTFTLNGTVSGCYTQWKPGTVYALGAYCYNGLNTYKCTVGGTSAGSGGPTGTATTGIVDNTAQWGFAGNWSAGHQVAQGTNPTLTGSSPNKVMTMPNVAAGSEWIFTNNPNFFITPGFSYGFAINAATAPYYGPATDALTGQPTEALPAVSHFNYRGSYFAPLSFTQLDQNAIYGSTSEAAYTYNGAFTFTMSRDYADFPMYLVLRCNSIIQNPSSIDFTIKSITMNKLPDVGQQTTLAGPNLDTMMRALLLGPRGPFAISDYAATGAQAIDTATGYVYGLYVPSGATDTVQQCAKRALDSVCGDIYVNRAGQIACTQLIAPESATAIGSLDINDFASYLQRVPDHAENLSTRISGARNISPYTDADFSGITEAQCSSSTRAVLKQPFGWTCIGGSQLAPRYAAANVAEPLPSCLDVQAAGQAEANRITALYSVPRNFYVGEVFTPIGRTLEIGDVWTVKYPTGSLINSQKLLVVGLIEKPSEQTSTVYFWGL
jgi:hypothetical protein